MQVKPDYTVAFIAKINWVIILERVTSTTVGDDPITLLQHNQTNDFFMFEVLKLWVSLSAFF